MTNKFVRNGLALALSSVLASITVPSPAAAFCGFFVTGADANLYSNATMVVMMREGTRTVLSIQNNYQGPPEQFALVTPVPVVLQKEQVNVLPNEVFTHIDQLGAPRLVEYWETDPCYRPPALSPVAQGAQPSTASASAAAGTAAKAAVRIEAQFAVGEYDVVVLSADDSSSLDTWLRENKYNIPAGAEPVLAPYVASGMKFFVAKVDPLRVKWNGDQAALSPLRFHYDSPEFSLPVRLGLLNSQGTQDLIINILAPKRYELANYDNVAIPTNIRVRNEVRDDFASFYEALFSRTLDNNPTAIVTEYSWAAGSCDPCPTPPLNDQDFTTLGGDVLRALAVQNPGQSQAAVISPYSFTLTRLHARYTKEGLDEDLVFKQADGIVGGRGMPDFQGNLDRSIQAASGGISNFQGRYVILHPWEKTLTCSNPQRGRWGGPPAGANPTPQAPANGALTGNAAKAGELPKLLAESLPALSVTASSPLEPLPGLPIAAGATPAVSITPTGTSGPLPSMAATPNGKAASAEPAPSNAGGLCSAAGAKTSGLFAPLCFVASLVAFAARSQRRRRRSTPNTHWLALALSLTLNACGRTEPQRPVTKPVLSNSAQPAAAAAEGLPSEQLPARVPRDEGPFYPSLARTQAGSEVDAESLADVKQCGACHQEAVKQWSSSAHAHASFDNPWYRSSVEALRSDVSFGASKHCGGCHDPVLLLGKKMDHKIEPADRLVNSGVTCLVCHSVRSPTSDGNASYTLNTEPVPFPVEGDPTSLARHRERLAADSLRTPALCATCHRGFLGRYTGIDHHLSGMDEPGAWRGSAFANTRSNTPEPVAAQTCAGCHMRAEAARFEEVSAKNGKLKSHRFAAAHTPFATQLKDARQLDAMTELLQHSMIVDVPVVQREGQANLSSELRDLQPGAAIALDVTLRNTSVGHSFPGGVKDMQDTWVELSVRDAQGREIARAGQDHETREDDSAFVLRALQVDAEGRPETRHVVTHFGTAAYDHTLPPLGARVVRYSFTLPQGSQGPLQVAVRVRHRRHRLEAREFACEATRSARGRAFIAEAKKRGEPTFDGCAMEPITEVASAQLTLGEAALTGRPTWQRLYDHALGLSLSSQEHLHEARWSAQRALELVTQAPKVEAAERAMVHTLLGRIEANRGRLADALEQASQAQALLGEHPAVARVRADAYARVWQWPAAAAALTELVRLAPGDTAAFRDLAKARYSAGDSFGALQAAQSGMALQPRDETLLRVQALALEAQKSPDAKAARDAFLYYREADETSQARIACDRRVPNCRRDRDPVVKIDLAPAATLLTSAVHK